MITTIKNFYHHSKNYLGQNKNKSASKTAESHFAALFYIRNTNIELEKDLDIVLKMVKDLEQCSGKIREILSAASRKTKNIDWEVLVDNVNEHLNEIREQLIYLKENRVKNTTLNASLFWQQMGNLIKDITTAHEKLEDIGFEILPEQEKKYWKLGICDLQNETFQSAVSRITMCRQQFEFIKKYTPNEINMIMKTIIENTPTDYSLEEARKYNVDYQKRST